MVVGSLLYWGLMLLWMMGVELDNTFAISGKWNLSKVILRLYGWVYKTLRLSPLVVEHIVVVTSARLNPMGNQFSIPVLKFVFRISGGIKFWDPVEDSNTSGPSLSTVWMEYVFAFQYWYCKLCGKNWWRGGRKHCFVFFGGALMVGGWGIGVG